MLWRPGFGRVALALALVLVSSAYADAHCFSVWRYPWPQHCGVMVAHPRVATHYAKPHRPVTLNPIDMLRAAMIGVVK